MLNLHNPSDLWSTVLNGVMTNSVSLTLTGIENLSNGAAARSSQVKVTSSIPCLVAVEKPSLTQCQTEIHNKSIESNHQKMSYIIRRRSERLRSKRNRNQYTKSTNSYCDSIMNQKDIIKMILSFIANNRLKPQIPFTDPVLSACYHIEDEIRNKRQMFDKTTYPHSFTVLPVTFKYINKIFNQCVNELSHLIVSIETPINLQKLSSFPNCKY